MGGQRTDKEQRARWWAAHPMGSGEPGRGQSTRWGGQSARWEAVHLDRTAPDGKQSATRGCAPGQKCTRWGVEHPMGSSTPGQNGCNAHRSGVVPSPTSTNEAHCRLPGHEAPLRLVGQSAVRVGGDASVGHRRGSRCVWVRWPPHRPPPRRVDRGACGAMRAWGIGADRGACGDDGRPAAPTPAPGGSWCVRGRCGRGPSTRILAQLVRQ